MEHIMSPMIYRESGNVSVYMDDTGAFAKDIPEAHLVNREILQRFREAGLYCKPSKCEFLKPEVELLGVMVDGFGFGVEASKVQEVQDWPVPKNLTEMKGFIGLC